MRRATYLTGKGSLTGVVSLVLKTVFDRGVGATRGDCVEQRTSAAITRKGDLEYISTEKHISRNTRKKIDRYR
tara:strand:- start:113 stop:331 length:219 start_codon:yes stop_codon:yes gene_type:complete